MIDAGEYKVKILTQQAFINSFMADVLLVLAAAFAIAVTINFGQPLLG